MPTATTWWKERGYRWDRKNPAVHLYAAWSPSLGIVKIGRSYHPHKRTSDPLTNTVLAPITRDGHGGHVVAVVYDLTLLAVAEYEGHRERQVLLAWERYRAFRREWFYAAPELLAWINEGCDVDDLLHRRAMESGVEFS